MRWRKLLGLLMVFAVIAAGCGDDDEPAATTQAPTTTATTSAPTTAATEAPADKVSVAILLPCAINDLSWCQAAYEGVKDLEAEGLIDLQVVDNAPFDAQGATCP